jgi:hypothetical protein
MAADVVDLRDFYRSALGQVARRMIRRAIQRVWPDLRGMRLLGIGYATPFLSALSSETERTLAVMPATLGVLRWPAEGRNLVSLAEEGELPFADYSLDRVVLVHALETSEEASALLKEIYRRAQPARDLGPARPHPVRLGASLYDVAALAIVAGRAVHPGRYRRRPLHPAGDEPDDAARGAGLGAHRQTLVSDLCRGAPGRGDKANLCQTRSDPRAAPPDRLHAGPTSAVAA